MPACLPACLPAPHTCAHATCYYRSAYTGCLCTYHIHAHSVVLTYLYTNTSLIASLKRQHSVAISHGRCRCRCRCCGLWSCRRSCCCCRTIYEQVYSPPPACAHVRAVCTKKRRGKMHRHRRKSRTHLFSHNSHSSITHSLTHPLTTITPLSQYHKQTPGAAKWSHAHTTANDTRSVNFLNPKQRGCPPRR